jgi:bacillolysin
LVGPVLRIGTALALLVAGALVVVHAFAPDVRPLGQDAGVEVVRAPDGAVRFLAAEPGQPSGLEAEDVVAQVVPPRSELVEVARTPRLAGGTAVRYQPVVGGIPVLGGEATVQLDPDGQVVSSLADLSSTAGSVATEARISAASARRQALAATARETGVAVADLQASPPERWLYDPAVMGSPSPLGVRLTWRSEVTDGGGGIRQLVLVDALTGGVVLSFSQLGHARERHVCDHQNVPSASAACVAPFTRSEGGTASPVPDVERAFVHAGVVYDWFADNFGRDSLDDQGMPLLTTVRHCRPSDTCPMASSFWTGREAVFGAGYPADDVVAHELAHGITEFTAHLFFWYQSGAINESMSDVFGELIDLDDGTGSDGPGVRWQIGEELPGGALRSMSDPPAFGDPDRMTSPLFTTTQGDSGGVHTNSGVGNKAAALLADGGTFNGRSITAVGVKAVAAIWYEALTTLLTSASDYADLGDALPQACVNLVGSAGITAEDCTEVGEAVDATEMASTPAGAPPPEAPLCAEGEVLEHHFSDDFEDTGSGNWRTSTAAGWAWSYPPPLFGRHASSGVQNLWGPDTGTPGSAPIGPLDHGDARIRMVAPVTLPSGAFLHFHHAWGFDSTGGVHRDGGVVELSVDGGPWRDLGPQFTTNGYNGTLAASGTNPLRGRPAFVDDSRGYTSSRADLGGLAGHGVRFRFRLGEDHAGGDVGWYVDDVRIATCRTPGLRIIQVADESTITLGEEIHLHLVVRNDGTAPLNGVTIDDPEAPACSAQFGQLDPGEQQSVDCTATPNKAGMWVNTASVSANELSEPVDAVPVAVTVLPPGTARVAVSQEADEDLVILGDPVHLHLTVRNSCNVELTGVTIVDPTAPDCETSLPPLAPSESLTIDCTVTPTEAGTFTTTASVTSTEVPGPTASNPVEVEVLDVTGPTVTVTSPADGQVVNQGAALVADYSCADEGSEMASCVGPVADGAPVDTSVAGDRLFTVVGTDTAGNRTEVTHTYTVARRRPDGRMRLGPAGVTVGDDIYNLTAAGQTRSGAATRGQSVTYFATLQNDGTEPEQLRANGQASTPHFTVRYWSGGVNITNAVVAGTWRTPVLAPGTMRTVKIVVTVRSSAPLNAQVSRTLTTVSTSDPSVKDVVAFITSRA